MITVQELEDLYDEICKSPGGESWFEIDGIEYRTDVGYALEGIGYFIEIIKRRGY